MSSPVNGTLGTLFSVVVGSSNKIAAVNMVAQVNSADPAALTDLNMTFLSVDPSGNLRVRGPTSGTPTFPVSFQSVGATGRVVAPGAGGAIVTIAAGSLPAGTYDVQVTAQFDVGAPVAAEINNMELRRGAGVVSALSVLAVLNVYSPVRVFRLILDGTLAV